MSARRAENNAAALSPYMQDLIAALVSFFLIEPLQAKVADKLAAARAPRAVLADVSACARAARPAIVDRAASDPWWAVSSIVQVWIGGATQRPPANRPSRERVRF